MRNIILCEGPTDGVLLQYFMRKVYRWEDSEQPKNLFKGRTDWVRRLKKGESVLDIVNCKGSSKLLPCTEYFLDTNKLYTQEETYNRLVIVTDRDENDTEEAFVEAARAAFIRNGMVISGALSHNQWTTCNYESDNGKQRVLEVLLLVVPFEDKGAMETFLLNSISKKDSYDANIIRKGNEFVDNADPDGKYLTKRRYVTKARFDVYFSVRTAAAQFVQRQDILRGVKWEEYIDIQSDFEKLSHL